MKTLLGILIAASLPLAAQSPILIQNATVLTITKGTLHTGSVLIRDGKIAEKGEKVTAPPGAENSGREWSVSNRRVLSIAIFAHRCRQHQ